MRHEAREVIERAQRSLAQMLLTDIDMAMMSLDISETTRDVKTRDSERLKALRAFEKISRDLNTGRLTAEDSTRISAALAPLKARLEAMGIGRKG